MRFQRGSLFVCLAPQKIMNMAMIWNFICVYLILLKSSEAQTLSLSVTPPSPVVGQEVTFTCTVSQDITADTTVYYRRNTVQVVEFTVTSTSCTSVYQRAQNYTATCGSLPVRHMSLTIPAAYVTDNEHGTDWRCNIFLGPVSNTVQLNLSVPVSTVTITTDGVYRPSVTISAGNTRTFTCTTTASRPIARLSWFRGGNNITDQAGTVTDQDIGDDKYTTQQSLIITGRVNYVDSGLKCEAVNIEGRTPVSSQTSNIIVQYQPHITVSSVPPSPIIEGRQLVLTCDVDSNPLSTVVWSRSGGQSLSGTSQSGGVHVIPSASRHDDGIYRCTATNSLKTNTLDMLLTVYYSPDNISITYSNITDDNTSRQLRCTPDGNPRLFKFSKWQHQSINGQLIRELDGVTIDHESLLTIPDPGLDTRYQDTGYYVCRVENGVPDRNNQLVFSRSVFVSVQSPPVFLSDESRFTGRLGYAAVIIIPFYTTTGYQKVELAKNNTAVDSQLILFTFPANVSVPFFRTQFIVHGFLTVISVQNLKENDFGRHVLTVTNDVGSQQFEFYLKETTTSASAKDSPIHDTGVAMLSTGVVLLLINVGIIGCLIIRKGRLPFTNKTTTSKPEATIRFGELTTSRRGNGEDERSTYEEIGKTDRSELTLDNPTNDPSRYENTMMHFQGNSAYESLHGRQKPNVYEELVSQINDHTGDNVYSNTSTGEET